MVIVQSEHSNQGAVREFLWYSLSTKISNSFIIVVGWWGLRSDSLIVMSQYQRWPAAMPDVCHPVSIAHLTSLTSLNILLSIDGDLFWKTRIITVEVRNGDLYLQPLYLDLLFMLSMEGYWTDTCSRNVANYVKLENVSFCFTQNNTQALKK